MPSDVASLALPAVRWWVDTSFSEGAWLAYVDHAEPLENMWPM